MIRALAVFLLLLFASQAGATIAVGSKKFTESVILGEITAVLLRESGFTVEHRRELGGTRILWSALLAGDIDLYPDYTGTLRHEILASDSPAEGLENLRTALRRYGVGITTPLGFNNTYALGMLKGPAQQRGIERISDLARYPELKLGASSEFLQRADGWQGLKQRYQLPQRPRGMDHDLAYRGLASGGLDVSLLYSTDAEIRYYDLEVLHDDRQYFPRYDAVIVYRLDLPAAAVQGLQRLQGLIDQQAMIDMNAEVKLQKVSEADAAAVFLASQLGVESRVEQPGLVSRLLRHTLEHLSLVGLSLGLALIIALPLGITAAKRPRLGQGLLAITGVLQTIPALALLVVMIPLLGIGAAPAIAALFLYSLLPIVRNTHAGLVGIPVSLRESALALGLPAGARLRRIEIPLALPSILAGIKTAVVINIGTATLGALVGAGGYGQPILTGIRLDDTGLILEGALPAALLAVVTQGLLERLERRMVAGAASS